MGTSGTIDGHGWWGMRTLMLFIIKYQKVTCDNVETELIIKPSLQSHPQGHM